MLVGTFSVTTNCMLMIVYDIEITLRSVSPNKIPVAENREARSTS